MPNAGNSLATATLINLNSTVQSFPDTVTSSANDYYRFTLSNRSSFNLSLTGLSADANVALLDSAGNPLSLNGTALNSSNTGTFAESINTTLEAGTYYIRVFPGGSAASADYSLNVALSNNLFTDILWRNYTTGQNGVWFMNGTTFEAAASLQTVGDLNWRLQAAGDFNKDGVTDLVWRNDAASTTGIWLMNGLSIGSIVTLPSLATGWRVAGTGDFNQDGNTDLLWQNYTNGQAGFWFLNGTSLSSFSVLTPAVSVDWRIQGVADFNRDGKLDIVWRNYNNGQNGVWFMNGTSLNSVGLLLTIADLNWQISGAGDFNRDGQPDLLWRNYSTGDNGIWVMNGLSIRSVVTIPAIDTSWRSLTPYIRTGDPAPIDVAGNSVPDAFDISGANLTGSATYRDSVGGADVSDYYRFTLSTASNINLSLTGLTANLDLQLFNSNGVLVQSSTLGGTTSESIINTLSSGTYFARIFPANGSSSSTYAFNLSVNNLPVLATNLALSVTEGSVASLTSSILRVTDNDNTSAQLIYTVGALPGKGKLLLNGNTISTGATFTQADIDNGTRLAYQHDGSETLTDSFTFTVSDGVGGSLGTNTFNIAVTPANDAPVLTVPPDTQFADQGANSTIFGVSIADPDAASGDVTVTLSATNGVLSLGSTSNIRFSQGTGVQNQTMIFSGTLTAVNNALNALIYRSNATFQGTDTINISVNDNGNTGVGGALTDSKSLAVKVTPINQAPLISLPVTPIANEDANSAISGISIADIDGLGGNVTVSLTAVNGVLSLNAAGLNLITGDGTQDRNIAFSGPLALVNSALSSLIYLGDKDFNGTDSIIVNVSDTVATGSGGVPLSDTKTLAVTVSPVNDAPLLNVPGAQLANENTNLRITGVSVSDVDATSGNVTVSLSAGNGTLTLGSTTGIAFTNGSGNQNANLIFSGTLAAVNDALSTLIYRGNANFNGTDTINLSVNDNGNTGSGIALSDTKSIAVNVLGVNNAPVISVPLAPSTNAGANLAIAGVSISDPDAGTGNLRVTIAAANGVLSLPTNNLLFSQGDGTLDSRLTFEGSLAAINTALAGLVYRSNPNFTGFETIAISVNDQGSSGIGTPLSDTRTLFVNVGGALNNPPIANPDTYTILRNTTLNVPGTGVLANDSDTDSSALNAVLVNLPTQGTLSLSSTGSFTYTPNSGFTGVDTFTYRASDGIANSGLATVTINVTVPANTAPTASPDIFLLNEDTPRTGNVLSNDTDTEDTRPGTAQLVSGPSNALSFTLNSDGTFNYTPTANYNGTDFFTYIAKDSAGASSNLATVSLSIAAVNDLPVAVNDVVAAFNEDTSTSGNVLTNDTDIEDTRPGTAQLISGPAHAVTFTLNSDGTFNYTPTANYNGTDFFTYIAKDSANGSSNTATVSLSITPVNDLPVATNDNFTVVTGGTFNTQNVLTNDTDIEDTRPGTAQLVVGPTNALSFTLNSDGSFTYVPNTGATTDSFTYVARDASGANSNTATVTLNVSSLPNTPPIAVNDVIAAFNEDTSTSGNVLTNDTDTEDTRPGIAQLISGPAHAATFTLNSDGTFNYTPTANYNGTDFFTYIAKDSAGASSSTTATVSLSITPVNDLPVATNDNFTVSAGGTLNTQNVLTNDTDIEDTRPGTAQLVVGPTNALSFTLNADGSFTYVPNTGATTDSFTYVAKDSASGFSNTATVTLNVSSLPNTPPIAVDDVIAAFNEDTSTSGNVLTNDTDTEDTRPGTAQLISGPAHAATFTLNSDGTFNYTPTANYNGTDFFTYIAKDSANGSSNTATVSLSITPVNDLPVATNDNFTVSAGGTLNTQNVLTNDTDIEDTRPGTAQLVVGPTNALSFTLNADGSFTYVPNTGATTDSFTYVAKDSAGGFSNTATVTLNVSSLPNTPPIAVDDVIAAFNEDTSTSGNVLTNDTDTEDTRPGVAQLINGPAHAATFTLNSDGTFNYTPTANYNGTDFFTYIAKDSAGASSSTTATVSLSITPVNDLPVAVNDVIAAFNEDTSTSGNVLTNDTDVEDTALAVAQLISGPAHAATFTLNSDGTFNYTPTANYNGTDFFTYIAKDSANGSSNTATVSLSITPVNDAPIANPDGVYRAATNTPLTILPANSVLLNDTDPDGQTPTAVATVTTSASGATVTLNADGTFIYNPATGFNGNDTFTYQATDGQATSNFATVTVSVGPNNPPIAANDSSTRYRTSPGVALTITSVDSVLQNDTDGGDGPSLSVVPTVTTSTNGGNVTLNADGSFVYNPASGFAGPTDTFTYRASDGLATSSLATVTINIGANTPPTATDDNNSLYRTTPGTPLSISGFNGVLQNDSDGGDGPSLNAIATVTTSANGGNVALNADGSFTYNPAAGFTGPIDTFTYRVTDGVDTSSPATVTISVSTNVPPTAQNDTGYRAIANGTLTVSAVDSVLNNDSDGGDGPSLRALTTVTTTANGGTVTLNADGSFIYRPATGFTNANDTFTYRVTDGVDTSTPATVTISVFTNTPPTVVNDNYSTTLNRALTITAPGVLTNDTDAENPITALLVTAPTNGSLILSSTGSFVYTPNNNYLGTDFFTYRANDGFVNSTLATVSLTVSSNVAPTANADSYSVNQNNTLVVPYNIGTATIAGVLSNDVDTDPLTASLVTGPTKGNLSFSSNGSFVYTPTVVGGTTDTFVYRASDGTLGSNATVTITIKNSSNAPTVATDAYSVGANTALTVPLAQGVLKNDSDPDGDRLSARVTAQPTNGSVTLNADGSFTYTPNANFTGISTFTYVASDGINDSAPATVTLTVGATNSPPVVTVPGSQVVFRNTDLTIASGLRISDPDAGTNPVRATLTAANGSLSLSTTSGLTVIDADGDKSVVIEGSITNINTALANLKYTPDLNYTGNDSIQITVDDKGNTGSVGGAQTGSGVIAVNVTSGAFQVKDINQNQNTTATGTESSSPTNLAAAGNTLYFAANDGFNGFELWKSDGTDAGTIFVADINTTVGGSSNPANFTVVGTTLFFTANNGTLGTELWKLDLNGGSPVLVKNIRSGSAASNPSSLVNFNGVLFFRADDGTGTALWRSDGTTGGTTKVGSGYGLPTNLTVVGNTLYFTGNTSQLWSTDGINTNLIKDLGAGLTIQAPIAIGNTLFFTTNNSTTGATELWRSNGTSAGTVSLSAANPGLNLSSPNNLVNLNGTLYFLGKNGANYGLYKSTEAGVVSLVQALPSTGQAPGSLTVVGSNLFFTADVGTGSTPDVQLWKSDGTTVGIVKDINLVGNANPTSLTNVNGSLFFVANDGNVRIWRSDGTDAGTAPVSGSFTGVAPTKLTAVGNRLFFTADTTATGTELWVV